MELTENMEAVDIVVTEVSVLDFQQNMLQNNLGAAGSPGKINSGNQVLIYLVKCQQRRIAEIAKNLVMLAIWTFFCLFQMMNIDVC